MDEPTDTPPAAGRRQRLVPPSVRLSPMQEAWRAYVVHSLHQCDVCRCADGSPCEEAERLYRAYRGAAAAADAAFDRVDGGAPSPGRQ